MVSFKNIQMPKWAPRALSVALSMALLVGAGQSLRYHYYGELLSSCLCALQYSPMGTRIQ